MRRAAVQSELFTEITRTVRGTPAELAMVTAVAQARRRLVAATTPRPVPGHPGLVYATVRLLVPVYVDVPRPRVRWRAVVVTAAVVVALAVLAGVAWLVLTVLRAVVAIGPSVFAAAVIGFVVWLMLGQLGACPGFHCPGCKCRH